MSRYIVAIAGVPGSGKSTTANAVSKCINAIQQKKSASEQDWAIHVPMDGFHLTRMQLDNLPNAEEAYLRRGADWTFDADQFVESIRDIRHAGFGEYPSFDHALGDPVAGDIKVCKEHRVVLVEGNYLLLDKAPWTEIRNIADETWFVDCSVEVAMQRVLRRQTGNGVAPEVARKRVVTNDLPNALQIAATKDRADLVLPALPMSC
ncbi:hypothetical protein WJX75_000079 [Coccomyxa subellipsoidea]|uniref:Phosphoribulokinase/uridine kinase domain-containing protein n=1 Tax=Coccomyxa subellipsoidea TaxID=248742 RepID=A0ABR2YLQ3_9CHLO